MKWFILICGIAANAMASVLVKIAMSPPRQLPSFSNPLAMLGNWPLLLGLSLYGLAFVLYAAALARFPLHVAHPTLTAGSIAVVAILSALLFREPFRWTTVAGIVMVIVGVVLLSQRAQH